MAVGKGRTSLTILLGAVGCTLLIACANLANLFLARATARHKEVAIRQALGARRSELVRQLMTESLLVCFAGGAIGLLAAWWAVGVFVTGLPAAGNFRMPRHQEIAMGWPVIAFNFAACLATGLLFGLVRHGAPRAPTELVVEGIVPRVTADRSGVRIRGASGDGDRDGVDAAGRRRTTGAELPQSPAARPRIRPAPRSGDQPARIGIGTCTGRSPRRLLS
jgi:putative ABC transport system permease protein